MKHVTMEEMNNVYEELKVPYKYGIVLSKIPDEENVEIDCQGVFSYNGKWYMSFVSHNSHSSIGGYRTHLASSTNLIDWNYEGCIFEQSENYPQCAAFPSLQNTSWQGSWELEQYDGKYWWSTMEGNVKGYEGMPMNMGQLTTINPSDPAAFIHASNLILSVNDSDVRSYETGTIYKSHSTVSYVYHRGILHISQYHDR